MLSSDRSISLVYTTYAVVLLLWLFSLINFLLLNEIFEEKYILACWSDAHF
jgi:hypothetical protein